MKGTKIIFLLTLVLFVLSFTVRFYGIGSLPSGILPDEASFGYNAYSILKTGKDEHGVFMPLMLKAFGERKLPAYAYLAIPSIKIFGLNNLAVRLPSAVAGSLITVFVFLILFEFGFSLGLCFIGGLIALGSPWTIHLSRFAFESNVGLLFFLSGIWLLLVGSRKKNIYLYISAAVCFGFTWYAYIAYWIISSLVAAGMLFITGNKKGLFSKYKIVFLLIYVLVALPVFFTYFGYRGKNRLQQAGYNSGLGMVMEINESRNFCSRYLPKTVCYANANKIVSVSRNLLYRYISTFSPDYMFLKGDKDSKYINVDNYGLFFWILLPFYLLGIARLWHKFKNNGFGNLEKFLLLGIITAPLPSLLVSDPQKIRLSGLFPFITILIVYGMDDLKKLFDRIAKLKYIYAVFLLFFGIVFGSFMVNLLTVHIQKYETAFGTYIPKLMRHLSGFENTADIYIRSIPEGILMYAYVNRTEPASYQASVIRKPPDDLGFEHASDFNNIHITENSIEEIYCLSLDKNRPVYFVTNEDMIKTGKVKKALRIVRSENNVDTLGFVYDVNDLVDPGIDCGKE